jgi:hypothetical protein
MEKISPSASATKQLFIDMVISAWNSHNRRISKLLDGLTDAELMQETAPGRNRGVYLIGHLIAISDALLPLLGLGERSYPQLDKVFVENTDRSVKDIPPVQELRNYWQNINTTLADKFQRMSAEDWFTRHNAVSEEDFSKEPHRNKLNVIINRTNHTSYHLGQLIYLAKKA